MTDDGARLYLPHGSKQSRLAGFIRAAALGLAFTATLTFVALPIGVAYIAYQQWIAGHTLQEASLHLEDAMLLLQGVGSLLTLVGAAAWVTVFLRRVDRQGDLRAVGFGPQPRGWLRLGLASAGGALFAMMLIAIAIASGQLAFGMSHSSLEGAGDVILDALGSVVIIASMVVAEELVFRGYVPWTLGRAGWTEEFSVLLSASLFAAYRIVLAAGSWIVFLNAFAAGILLGLLTRLTRSLHLTIGARLGWALALGTVFSLPVGGSPVEGILHSLPTPGLALDGGYGPEGSWLVLPILAIAVALAQRITIMRRQR